MCVILGSSEYVIAAGDFGCESLASSIDKRAECRYCHKQFTTVYNARSHERIHTGEQPYHCTFCDRKFHDRSSLRVHLRTHTGIRPFRCQFCQKAFSQMTNLRVHNLHCTEPVATVLKTSADIKLETTTGDDNLDFAEPGNNSKTPL